MLANPEKSVANPLLNGQDVSRVAGNSNPRKPRQPDESAPSAQDQIKSRWIKSDSKRWKIKSSALIPVSNALMAPIPT